MFIKTIVSGQNLTFMQKALIFILILILRFIFCTRNTSISMRIISSKYHTVHNLARLLGSKQADVFFWVQKKTTKISLDAQIGKTNS